MIHATADVSQEAKIGKEVLIWHQVQIREKAVIGDNCILGKGVYIDFGVSIGNNVKIQNYSCIYHGATVEDGVFIGPNVILLNDKTPRAITPDGNLKKDNDWHVGRVHVREGASIGGGAIILPGVTVGKFSLVGAGAVVTRNVPDHALVFGNPAKVNGFVCKQGHKLKFASRQKQDVAMECPLCKEKVNIDSHHFVDE